MEREPITLKMDPDLWKEARKHCIDKEVSFSNYVENLIKKDLNKGGKS